MDVSLTKTHGNRYNAACAAALAGCGQGKDSKSLVGADRQQWRMQAIEWVREELAVRKKRLREGDEDVLHRTIRGLKHWQGDGDLSGLRDKAALDKLPVFERQECQALCEDVEAAIERTEKRGPTDR